MPAICTSLIDFPYLGIVRAWLGRGMHYRHLFKSQNLTGGNLRGNARKSILGPHVANPTIFSHTEFLRLTQRTRSVGKKSQVPSGVVDLVEQIHVFGALFE